MHTVCAKQAQTTIQCMAYADYGEKPNSSNILGKYLLVLSILIVFFSFRMLMWRKLQGEIEIYFPSRGIFGIMCLFGYKLQFYFIKTNIYLEFFNLCYMLHLISHCFSVKHF